MPHCNGGLSNQHLSQPLAKKTKPNSQSLNVLINSFISSFKEHTINTIICLILELLKLENSNMCPGES